MVIIPHRLTRFVLCSAIGGTVLVFAVPLRGSSQLPLEASLFFAQSTTAQDLVQEPQSNLRSAETSQKYNLVMQSGYGAAQSRHYDQARQFFQDALELKPNDIYARQALFNIDTYQLISQQKFSSFWLLLLGIMATVIVLLAIFIVISHQSQQRFLREVGDLCQQIELLEQSLVAGEKTAKASAASRTNAPSAPAALPLSFLSSSPNFEDANLSPKTIQNTENSDYVEQLLSDLGTADDRKRRKILRKLAQNGDSRAVKPLVDLMMSSDSQMRNLILETLAQISTRTLQPMYQALDLSLTDKNPQGRESTMRNLNSLYNIMSPISQQLSFAVHDNSSNPMTKHLPKTNGHSRSEVQPTIEDNGTLANVKEREAPIKLTNVKATKDFWTTEQSMILRQSSLWSRGVVWGIVGVTVISVIWANVATIEEVIPATGQLKPLDTVKDVQAPINGVVKTVLVKDNERVRAGQTLVIMDSTTTASDLESARKIKQATLQENAFYRSVLQKGLSSSQLDLAIAQLKLPWEVAALAKNRTGLEEENRLYQTLLGSQSADSQLTPDQEARLRMTRFELRSRVIAAEMEIQQLQKQLEQAEVQLDSAQRQLIDDKKIFADLMSRNQKAIAEAEKSLKIEKGILDSVTPLLEEGALAKLQVDKQQQSINDRTQKMIEEKVNGSVEFDKQRQQIQTREAEISRLKEEKKRINALINQAQARLVNTGAITQKEVYDRIADNTKKIADIDSQLTKIIVENNKKVNELNSQISRSQVALKYQEVKSPVNGTVFDLKATPGYVTPPQQTVPLLKIVPKDYLVAEVDVTNKDIGFVRSGMKAEVRIDSFPYSEFGDIKGKVDTISSDALPPDENHRYYRFPVKIKLDNQYLKTEDRKILLQSGMSVTANIKVREKRTVMSLFTELFTKKIESLETVR